MKGHAGRPRCIEGVGATAARWPSARETPMLLPPSTRGDVALCSVDAPRRAREWDANSSVFDVLRMFVQRGMLDTR